MKQVIEAGRLIDGTGRPPIPNGRVVVDDGRITAAGPADSVALPESAESIDASAATVMPGLIDGHNGIGSSFSGVRRLRLYLQWGVTTAANFHGNRPGQPLAGGLRDAIEEGHIRGASRLLVGYAVNCTHGHNKGRLADGPWEVRKAVREMAEAGADFIKTAASGGFWGKRERCAVRNYTPEELNALVDEAHAWDRPVGVHVHTQPGLNNAIEAGVDIIYHGCFIDEEALEGIAGKGLYYLPTLKVTSEPNLTAWKDRPWMWEEMRKAHDIHREGVRKAHQMGITLVVGTDGPGASFWRAGETTSWELMELVACGLTPMEAIVAATRDTARAYRIDAEVGTLEAGKKADVLVVNGDPSTDISVLHDHDNIQLVMKDGSVEYASPDYRHHYVLRDPQEPGRLASAWDPPSPERFRILSETGTRQTD